MKLAQDPQRLRAFAAFCFGRLQLGAKTLALSWARVQSVTAAVEGGACVFVGKRSRPRRGKELQVRAFH